MNSIVVYGSRYGNTEKVAYRIAAGLRRLGLVEVLSTEEARLAISQDIDLVVIGGPTEAHRVTEPVVRFFDKLGPEALNGKVVAAFDTRLRGPRWLTGSAAVGIASRFRHAGIEEILATESFIVAGQPPELMPGELDRAEAWADRLGSIVENRSRVAMPV